VIASSRGQHDRCGSLLRDAIRLREALGDHAGLAECFTALADDLALRGRHTEAAVLLAAAESRRQTFGISASAEEVRTAERVEARRRDAGALLTGNAPTLAEILGPTLVLDSAPEVAR
jgi:hypothetical protein